MSKRYFLFIALLLVIGIVGIAWSADPTYFGALGARSDPDFTGHNGETISNATDGTWALGSANLTMTGTLTVTGNIAATAFSPTSDITMAAGKYIKSAVDSNTVTGIQGYNDDAEAYITVFSITNDNVPAVVAGNDSATLALSSSDWDVSTTGVMTGIGNITSDGDIIATGGDFTGSNGNFVDIGEAVDGTITFGRDDAGTVTLTSVDNDANAALTVSAGGTGALTLGDAGSTTAITSSDWAIGATGIATGLGNITTDGDITMAEGKAIKTTSDSAGVWYLKFYNDDATAWVNAIRLTNDNVPAMVVGNDSATLALSSSDWDISATGVMTGIGNITSDGTISDGTASLTAGALSGISTLAMTDDLSLATGKAIKTSTTDAHTGAFNVYDTNSGGATGSYRNALLVTNGTTPAVVVGNDSSTLALSSSDWDISTTGVMSGIGNITSDGVITNGTISLTAGALSGVTTLSMGGALSGVTTAAISGKVTGGGDIETDDNLIADQLKLGHAVLDSTGRQLIYVQNKSGGSLAEGDVCIWDNTEIVVEADTIVGAAFNTVVDNSLSAEGGFFSLSYNTGVDGAPDAGDSIKVIGVCYETGRLDTIDCFLGTAVGQFEILEAGAKRHFSTLTSLTLNADAISDGADTLGVQAHPVAGVVQSSGSVASFAGVATGVIADNAFGYIVNQGITKVTVDAATLDATAGAAIDATTAGDGVTAANWTVGQTFGVAVEYSSTDNLKILVDIR